MNGKKVVMAFPGDGIGSRIFPADLARFLNDFYRQKGVEVLAGELVTGMEMRQGKPVLKIRNAQTQSEREIIGRCRGGGHRHPAQRRTGPGGRAGGG